MPSGVTKHVSYHKRNVDITVRQAFKRLNLFLGYDVGNLGIEQMSLKQFYPKHILSTGYSYIKKRPD